MEPFLVVPLVIVAAVVVRLVAGWLDRDRIREYIEHRGGKVLSCRWTLYGPGWFGDRDRIYRVRYCDKDNCHHQAYIARQAS